MNRIEKAVTLLREIGASLPTDAQPVFGLGAEERAISAIEQKLGSRLPADFRTFLGTVDCVKAMQVWNGYWLGGANGIQRSLERQDPPQFVALPSGPIPVLPAGSDGGGNIWVLAAIGQDRVWKWNHETGRAAEMAETFAAFLERVAEDWRHFAINDLRWPYISG